MGDRLRNVVVLLVVLLCQHGYATSNSFTPPPVLESGGCIRVGEAVNFTCVANDMTNPIFGSTVWRGSAFDCPSDNDITLQHSQYANEGGESGTCGSFMAQSGPVTDTCYPSTLTITATTALDETVVECTLSEAVVIGNSTLQIGVVPGPPQLEDIVCTPRSPLLPDLSSTVSSSALNISWQAPVNGPIVEGDLSYPRNITVDSGVDRDCGLVINSALFSVVYSDWVANGQVCTFEVMAMEDPASRCGFTGEPVSVAITFEVPVEPTSVEATMTCSNMNYLPIQVEWTVAAVAMDAPCYLVPVATYLQCSGPNANATCVQENLLGSNRVNVIETQFAGGLVVREVYSFSVLQENVIGQGAARSDNITVRRVEIDDSTAADEPPVITVTLNLDCSESPGEFTCVLSTADVSTPVVFSDNYVAVIPIDVDTTTDYMITIEHGGNAVEAIPKTLALDSCPASDLVSSDSRVTNTATGATAPHGSVVNFACSGAYQLSGPASARCRDGVWTPAVGGAVHSCKLLPGVIAAIVIAIVVLLLLTGGGASSGAYLAKRQKSKAQESGDRVELKNRGSPDPPITHGPNALYSNPTDIRHEAAPESHDQYAMLDTHTKKKPKPPAPKAQESGELQKQVGPEGDVYTVPVRGSSKRKQESPPPSLPPPSEEQLAEMYATPDMTQKGRNKNTAAPLVYADIGVSASSRSAPVPPAGQVTYSTIAGTEPGPVEVVVEPTYAN